MNESSRRFLDEKRGHYDMLEKAGIITHLDQATKNGILNVIRIEFQAGYNANLWCSDCVAEMIRFAYRQYDKWKESQPKAGPEP